MQRKLTAMTFLIVILVLAAATVVATLVSPDIGFDRQLCDLDALRDARGDAQRWLR